LSQAKALETKIETGKTAVLEAKTDAVREAASKELTINSRLHTNQIIDAFVAGTFLVLVSIVVLMSVVEWLRLLSGSKPAVLSESEPVWLPDYAVNEGGRGLGTAGTVALTLALAKELSGEAHLDRAQTAQLQTCKCDEHSHATKTESQIYVEATEQRFNGVRRCC
jgi:hypothetical protein